MHFSAKFLPSLILFPILVACSGDIDDKTTSGSPGGNRSLDELAERVKGAYCTSAVDCHHAETKAECIASMSAGLDEIEVYVENGTIKYHPEKVDACIAALEKASSCSQTESTVGDDNGVEEACGPIFEGQVAIDDACFDDLQCVTGECQEDETCMGECCPGKCVSVSVPPPPAKIGEACPTGHCEAGAYCQLDDMFNPTTCAAQIAEGQPCTSLGACLPPAYCNLDFGTNMGTCIKAPSHGEACDSMALVPCDRVDDDCHPTTKVCTLRALPGEACMGWEDCVGLAYCDLTMMTCKKRHLEGEACGADVPDCLGNLSCENGKCAFVEQSVCP